MTSIRALLLDELGFDPDDVIERARTFDSVRAHSEARGPLAGALPTAIAAPLVRLRARGTGAVDSVAEVAAGLDVAEVAAARHGEEPVAVVRTATGRLYVLPDRCPHDGGPISDGFVDGEHVVCARHGWEIEACSGRCGRASAGAAADGPTTARGQTPPAKSRPPRLQATDS
jgi:nitrite reductase/ring-hydroxylating ferredoxin subunit